MSDIYDEEPAPDEDIEALEDDGPEGDFVDGESFEIPGNLPVYQLYLPYAHEMVYATYKGDEITVGMRVLVPTRYGRDLAEVRYVIPQGGARQVSRVVWIVRPADGSDLEKVRNNTELEKEALRVCRGKIDLHDLDMKLVSAHYLLDEPKIIFFFTSENRVDFRELVKDLVGIFKSRIELRQIGIRDESRILGGMGQCGREFCCHAVCDRMKPV
jgi:cell fate regulator YaaT (PSP1 superfamily)